MRHRIVQLSAAVLLALAAFARSPQAQPPVAVGATAPGLNVFLDCERMFCDFDYFRTEMTWVSWVRDRAVADVHVLVSTQETGAGGSEYTRPLPEHSSGKVRECFWPAVTSARLTQLLKGSWMQEGGLKRLN